jgi:hypothetical protein
MAVIVVFIGKIRREKAVRTGEGDGDARAADDRDRKEQ